MNINSLNLRANTDTRKLINEDFSEASVNDSIKFIYGEKVLLLIDLFNSDTSISPYDPTDAFKLVITEDYKASTAPLAEALNSAFNTDAYADPATGKLSVVVNTKTIPYKTRLEESGSDRVDGLVGFSILRTDSEGNESHIFDHVCECLGSRHTSDLTAEEIPDDIVTQAEFDAWKAASSHTHSNTDDLDKLSVVDNKLKVNGVDVGITPEQATDITSNKTHANAPHAPANAEPNQSDSEIKTQYENNANTNAFTDAEKAKLAGVDNAKYLGTFTNLTALQTAHPTATEGQYAHVDAGVGSDVQVYIWDNNDSQFVVQAGSGTTETAASIKTKYESNADTNVLTDTLLAKLNSILTVALSGNSDDLTEGVSKLLLTVAERAAIAANSTKTGITPEQATDIANNKTHASSSHAPSDAEKNLTASEMAAAIFALADNNQLTDALLDKINNPASTGISMPDSKTSTTGDQTFTEANFATIRENTDSADVVFTIPDAPSNNALFCWKRGVGAGNVVVKNSTNTIIYTTNDQARTEGLLFNSVDGFYTPWRS